MKLKFYEEELECSKVVKGEDYIHCLNEKEDIIASFGGISDFSGYSVEDGEFSAPPVTELEQLRADVDFALMMVE